MTGTGNNGILPGDPSYSADGRYLIYDTVPCNPSGHALLHIRDLSTGRELTRAGFPGVSRPGLPRSRQRGRVRRDRARGRDRDRARGPADAVHDRDGLPGAARLPVSGAGRNQTETGLDALLQCGPGHELSIVAISPRTFTVTRTLIRLGSCLGGETISLAPPTPRRCSRKPTTRACAGRARRLPHREDPRRPGVARDVRPGCAAVGLLVTTRPARRGRRLILLTRLVPGSPGRLAYSTRLVPGSSVATGTPLGAAAGIILVIRAGPALFMIASWIA